VTRSLGEVAPFDEMDVQSSSSLHFLHEFVGKSHDVRLSLTLAKRTTLEPHATVGLCQRLFEFGILLRASFLGLLLGKSCTF